MIAFLLNVYKETTLFLYTMIAILASSPLPKATTPIWLISPKTNFTNLIQVPGVSFDTSNNNLAIKIYKGRLYLAVRTAPHHHPRPPIWARKSKKVSHTRLYVLSCPFGKNERQQLQEGKTKSWSWSLEFEASERLEKGKLCQLQNFLSSDQERNNKRAEKEIRSLLGKSPKQIATNGYLSGCDYREPIFFELNGELHLLFLQVAGVPMRFEPLRAWWTKLDIKGKWTSPSPILQPGEHFWSVRVRDEKQSQVAYLSLAKGGGHYDFVGKQPSEGIVDLVYSTDGQHWKSISCNKGIDRGRACEPVLGFSPNGKTAWMLLRCEDADTRGWGSLLGWAEVKHLAKWHFPKEADPRRFDSARFFNVGEDMYVIARQRLAKKGGKLDYSRNAPYGPGTKPNNGSDMHSLILMASYGVSPMRTALYKLVPKTQRLEHILTLPSSGDTAFPSIESLDANTVLIANYSSPLEDSEVSWLEGQNNRTGVYLITLRFPAK